MDTKYLVLVAAVGVTFFISVLGLSRPEPVTKVVDRVIEQLGATGSTYTTLQEFDGGVKYGNTVSTSTSASVTATAGQFREWVNADVVIVNPTGAASIKTITFPASSTVADVLQQPGDMTKTCFYNATTSAAATIAFAGGTGTPLNVASSTATVLGSANIMAGEVGCFTFVRGAVMPTAFDITANFVTFR